MPVGDIVALLLSLVIAVVVSVLATGIADAPVAERWEGGVAVGLTAMIVLGPFWIAQAVLTVLATLDDAGIAACWLWAWLFLAPVFGASAPVRALVRSVKRLSRNRIHRLGGDLRAP